MRLLLPSLNQDHLRRCIDQIEDLFISESRMEQETMSSPSKASTSSSSADSGLLLLSSPEGSGRLLVKKEEAEEEEKQRTPTEVFRVSALCVT